MLAPSFSHATAIVHINSITKNTPFWRDVNAIPFPPLSADLVSFASFWNSMVSRPQPKEARTFSQMHRNWKNLWVTDGNSLQQFSLFSDLDKLNSGQSSQRSLLVGIILASWTTWAMQDVGVMEAMASWAKRADLTLALVPIKWESICRPSTWERAKSFRNWLVEGSTHVLCCMADLWSAGGATMLASWG